MGEPNHVSHIYTNCIYTEIVIFITYTYEYEHIFIHIYEYICVNNFLKNEIEALYFQITLSEV